MLVKNNTEIWEAIDDYGGKYCVSNMGRIMSFQKDKNGQIISQWKHSGGYLCVTLKLNGKKKNHYVHRLVGKAFVENKEDKPEINHKDGNKHFNIHSNIEWATDSENKLHRYRVLGQKHTNRRRIFAYRFGKKELEFESLWDAKKAGFDLACVWMAANNYKGAKSHKGYEWKYAA